MADCVAYVDEMHEREQLEKLAKLRQERLKFTISDYGSTDRDIFGSDSE